jgi:hypothetical protein
MNQSDIKSLAKEITSKYAIHLTRSSRYRSLPNEVRIRVRKEAYRILINASII